MTAATIDIHERLDDAGYTVARHILSEIDAAPGHRLGAGEAGEMVGNLSGQVVGQWLRAMKERGWVTPHAYGQVKEIKGRIRPGVRTVWAITDAGATELEEYRVDGLIAQLVNVDSNEDLARQRYGNERVDRWFRECMDTDPDAARENPPPTPPSWVNPAVPLCDGCGRTLEIHKGHWTCCERACPEYGASQGCADGEATG